MIKTGLEIVQMIAKGEAPKKIKKGNTMYELDDEKYYIYQVNGKCVYHLDIIAYLNDEFEIIEEPKVWKPEKDERYYCIDDCDVSDLKCDCDKVDKFLYETGNCFKTQEEAYNQLFRLKIYMRLKRYAEEHNTEPINWCNKNQSKWLIFYNFRNGELDYALFNNCKDIGQIYFTSEKLCKQAIKDIGEDTLKKLFEEE